MAAADNIVATLNNACARLAEIDSTPVDQQVRAMESAGFVSMDWNAFRASLVDEVARLTELVGKVRTATQGPFTVRSGTVRG